MVNTPLRQTGNKTNQNPIAIKTRTRCHCRYGIIIAVIFFLAVSCTAVCGVTLETHYLGRSDNPGSPNISVSHFMAGDEVVSTVYLNGAVSGDTIRWEFHGPNEISWSQDQVLEKDQANARSVLNLARWPGARGSGTWTLDLLLNREQVKHEEFTVEPLTGLIWWGPFLGAFLLVLGILVIGGIIVVILVAARKKAP